MRDKRLRIMRIGFRMIRTLAEDAEEALLAGNFKECQEIVKGIEDRAITMLTRLQEERSKDDKP